MVGVAVGVVDVWRVTVDMVDVVTVDIVVGVSVDVEDGVTGVTDVIIVVGIETLVELRTMVELVALEIDASDEATDDWLLESLDCMLEATLEIEETKEESSAVVLLTEVVELVVRGRDEVELMTVVEEVEVVPGDVTVVLEVDDGTNEETTVVRDVEVVDGNVTVVIEVEDVTEVEDVRESVDEDTVLDTEVSVEDDRDVTVVDGDVIVVDDTLVDVAVEEEVVLVRDT